MPGYGQLYGIKDYGNSEKDNILKAVYRQKTAKDGDNNYKRMHFETSSEMVYDATNEAIAGMISRRSSDGSIKYNNLELSGNLLIKGLIMGSNGVVGSKIESLNADMIDGLHATSKIADAEEGNLWTGAAVKSYVNQKIQTTEEVLLKSPVDRTVNGNKITMQSFSIEFSADKLYFKFV